MNPNYTVTVNVVTNIIRSQFSLGPAFQWSEYFKFRNTNVSLIFCEPLSLSNNADTEMIS